MRAPWLPGPALMEIAGRAVADTIARECGGVNGRSVLVLIGPGNNGGDGLVAARHLHDAGAIVRLYLWRRRDSPGDTNRLRCRERNIPEIAAADDPDRAQLRRELAECDLVVDALLGMGVSRA